MFVLCIEIYLHVFAEYAGGLICMQKCTFLFFFSLKKNEFPKLIATRRRSRNNNDNISNATGKLSKLDTK